MFKTKKAKFVGLLMATTAATPGAIAQDNDRSNSVVDDVIIVSGEKREQNLQDLAAAAEVISGEQIRDEGRSKLDDVLVNATSVIIQGQARGFTASIRGLGLSLPPGVGQAAVSNYYDGVFSERAESASAGFYDVERLEILRGPQSTLYGRNSVGGLFNVIYADPELGEFGGYIQGEVGNYSLFRGEGAVNIPVGDTVAVRVSGAAVDRDGFMSNGHDDNVAQSIRGKILFQPNDAFKTVVAAEYTHLGGEGPGAIPLVNFGINRDTTDPDVGFQDYDNVRIWANLEAEIGPGLLTLLPSYQRLEGELFGAFGGNFVNGFDPRENKQVAFEARYQSKPESPVVWSLGYYFYDSRNERLGISGVCQDMTGLFLPDPGFSNQPNALGMPGPPPPPGTPCLPTAVAVNYTPDIYETQSQGVFGQATVPLGDDFRVTGGIRYNWEEFQRTFNPFDGTAAPELIVELPLTEEDNVDWKAALEYDVTDDNLVYVNVASGYRTGGYNVFDPAGSTYAPEDVISYEIGTKNAFFGGRWLLNASAFYYDYKNYQLVFGDGLPPPIGFITITGQPAELFGAEVETAIAVGNDGRLTGSVVFLDSDINDTGIAFPNSPDFQLKGSYAHDFAFAGGVVTPRIDFRHLTEQFVFPVLATDPPPVIAERTQDAFTTADFFVSYAPNNGNWGVTAYVKNMTDAAVKTSSFFGFGQLQPPRTYGATVRVSF